MVVKISRAFKDISLSFTKHPVTNDVTVLKNEDAIKKSVSIYAEHALMIDFLTTYWVHQSKIRCLRRI